MAEIVRDHPEAKRLEVWFLDEARVGQTGRVCRRWFERGMRPRGMRDLRHQAVYLFAAVCPERDAGVALWTMATRTIGASVRGSEGAFAPQAPSANGKAQTTVQVARRRESMKVPSTK